MKLPIWICSICGGTGWSDDSVEHNQTYWHEGDGPCPAQDDEFVNRFLVIDYPKDAT